VFPKAKDDPPVAGEAPVGVAIPSPITFDLFAPPRGIRFWPCAMDRTAVPKAAVDEHRDLRTEERDVSATARSGEREVHAISKTTGV
jgi:hypothetical protein